MMKQWQKKVGIGCLILFGLTFAIAFAIYFFPLYAWDISRLGIEEQTGFSKKVLMKEYRQLLAYLTFPWDTQLSLAHFPMSPSGRSHFVEVKRLFLLNNFVLLVTCVPSVLFVKQLIKEKNLWQLVRPFEWLAGLPLILGALLLIGFQTFFEQFHHLLFRNDDWLFDPATDPIILALPEEFFMHCFILAFFLLEVWALLWILIGRKSLKKRK